jgi:hypothetical protein
MSLKENSHDFNYPVGVTSSGRSPRRCVVPLKLNACTKSKDFYHVHKLKQPTVLFIFKRLARSGRCSFCKGVFNLWYTTLLGVKGNMCLRRMSVSRSKRLIRRFQTDVGAKTENHIENCFQFLSYTH